MAMMNILRGIKKPQDETVTIPFKADRICSEGNETDCVMCFGSNVYGRLGVPEKDHLNSPNQIVSIPRLIGSQLQVNEIACGAAHTICCIQGKCYSWGKCHFGQLGLGSEWMNCFSPTLIPLNYFNKNNHSHLNNEQVYITSVGCGESHSMVITSNGLLYTFGCGFNGVLGLGNENHQVYPTQVMTFYDSDYQSHQNAVTENNFKQNPDHLVKFQNVTGGKSHSIASNKEGFIFVWGKNDKGQLGLGDQYIGVSKLTPTILYHPPHNEGDSSNQSMRVKVYASRGGDISGYVFNNNLFLWGNNENNILGIDDENDIISIPTEIKQFESLSANIAIGKQHILVATIDGEVYSWGSPGPWLGREESVSSPTNQPHPLLTSQNRKNDNDERIIQGMENTRVSIACGEKHSVVISPDGSLLTCGELYLNKLGNRKGSHAVLSPVLGLERSVAVTALGGSNHTVVVTTIPTTVGNNSLETCLLDEKKIRIGEQRTTIESQSVAEEKEVRIESRKDGTLSLEEFNIEAECIQNLRSLATSGAPVWRWCTTNSDQDSGRSVSSNYYVSYLSLSSPWTREVQVDDKKSIHNIVNKNDVSIYLEEEEMRMLTDEATLRRDSKSDKNVVKLEWKADIVYSNTWQVPVLYFNIFANCCSEQFGNQEETIPLTWSAIEYYLSKLNLNSFSVEKDEKTTLEQLQKSVWPKVSQEFHPGTGEPCYMLHPCHTAEQMLLLSKTSTCATFNYLLAWINIVGKAIGICIPPLVYISCLREIEDKSKTKSL